MFLASDISRPRHEEKVCFICGKALQEVPVLRNGQRIQSYHCPYCGHYSITWVAAKMIEEDSDLLVELEEKGAALAAERRIHQRDGYVLSVNEKGVILADGIPFLADFPKTFPEQLDRALSNVATLANLSPFQFMEYKIAEHPFAAINEAVLFVSNKGGRGDENIQAMVSIMFNEGWIIVKCFTDGTKRLHLTLKGIEHALELSRIHADSKNAFLAMWFTELLNPFKDAVIEGAKGAGYSLHTVNDENFNDFIMDKVINMIQESRFVIADLTSENEEIDSDKGIISGGVRGGVYWEAGYAKGLGRPVILTCRGDDRSKMMRHFDVQQLNTIFWEEKDGRPMVGEHPLAEVIKARILATIGESHK